MAKAPAPTYRAVTITPDLAREWLTRNTRNRNLNQKRVDHLAEAMKRGEWQENGDTIRFDRNGVLLDGQKRLLAVLQSRVSIRAQVVEGLEPGAQMTIDIGQPRSFGQHLQLEGYKDHAVLASTVRRVWAYETTGEPTTRFNNPSFAQLQFLVDTHETKLREAIARAGSVKAYVRKAPESLVATAWWAFSHIDLADAEWFFDRLHDGAGLAEGHPVLALRQAMIRVDKDTTRGRPDDRVMFALFVKAWNAYRRGDQVQALYWRSGGARPEPFPKAV